jgi:hypothetical protein
VDDTEELLEQYREFMEVRGLGRPLSPTGVIEQWGSFVEECEDGYDLNIDEFWNDLTVRRLIARMLRNPELCEVQVNGVGSG